MKKFLLSLLCGVASLAVWAVDATSPLTVTWENEGYANQAEVTTVTKAPVAFTFAAGSNSNPPKYYTTGKGVRLYGGNTMTVSVTSGYVLKSVVLTTAAGKYVIAEGSTVTNGTIAINSNITTLTAKENVTSMVLTEGGTSGHARIQTIEVNFGQASDPTKKDAGLSFPQAEYNAVIGEAFTKPDLTKATTAAVEYASSNEKVATVDAATGEVTLVHWGETTITATAPADGDFNAGSASYTLKVTDPNANDGTLEKPYTVPEAIEACAAGATGVYAKGVITSVGSYNATYGSISYYIGETKDATETLSVYSGLNIGGEKFTGVSDIEVGATVVVKGNLTLYKNAPQFDKNNELVSYVAPVKALGDICTWSWGEGNTGTLTAGAEKVTVEVLKGMTVTFTCENATKMTYTSGGMTDNTPGSADGSSIEYVVTGSKPNFKLTAEGVDENGNAVTKNFNVDLLVQVLPVGEVSATLPDGNAIEANGSYTITEGQAITISAENAVKYQISYDGQAAADMEGNSYTFNAVGENISVVFYAIGSDTSQKEIAFTLTVAAKPVEDELIVDAFGVTNSYKPYSYTSTSSKVKYEAKAYNSNGMQINSGATSSAKNSGIASTANPDKRAIKQIVVTVYGGNGTISVKAGNEANSLTGTGTAAAVNVAESATELTAAVDGKVYTYTPSNCTFFAVTSSGVVQITSINVIYGEPNSGTVTGIEGVEVMDANAPVEYYNLQGVRVAEPTSGLYIRRQGGKISKVVIR